MLTSLEIENFKGIAARQRIDFAPLTLLFGANSAGKSTILQVLLYLHELIERGSADVDRTELGGSVLELGGFARLVHRHDRQRAIVLRAEFATPGGLERFGRDLTEFPFPDLDDEVESAWLELTIQHRTAAAFHGAMVERAAIGVNGELEPLVWLETPGSLREGDPLYARINLGHPLVADAAANVAESWLSISVPEPEWHRGVDPGFPERGAVIGLDDLLGFTDGRALPLVALSRSRLSALPPPSEPLRVIPLGEDAPEKAATAQQVRTFLEMVLLGTTAQLASFLRDAQYIGPLRTIPPRGFLYERAGRITSWADGLAAWDLLLADRLTLVERTNVWLRRLGAGCQVVVQQLFDGSADAEELSDGHVDKTVRRLLLDTGGRSFVLPSEVGAGISQLIPVVVAAIEGRGNLTLVEQPEIHVHPAVQVGLGDLLIEAINREGSRRTLLVETHSEHLILRLLRRIRETTEKELAEDAPAFCEDKLSVLYVEATPEGVRVRRLRVDEQGEFVDRWPKGFFAERMEELL
ncbi:AAA family ATPase [Sorangium sp. So ce394]|uniref:AAA family ATPase n=1 Tax=Sorangium sp. So ce394 TaxID=3133310 RepID=UPI003F5AE840